MDIRQMLTDRNCKLTEELEALCARHNLAFAILSDPDEPLYAIALCENTFESKRALQFMEVLDVNKPSLAFQSEPKEN